MRREFLILRHAKSSWADPGLDDFDRPLAPRGLRDAPRIGAEIARRGWTPAMALVSPARRTRETWQRVAARLPPAEVSYRQRLYEATSDDILAEMRQTPARVARLVVVGHNPGLAELAVALAGPGSDERSLAALGDKFPTAALARFETDAPWREIATANTRLVDFLTPRALPHAAPD